MLKFRINTTPTAQQRARHGTTKNGLHIAFKSEKQRANERTLEALLQPYVPEFALSGPLVLEFTAALPLGKSDSKKVREAKLSGEMLPEKKPDIDNITKQLMDAMTRLNFWYDDVQVVRLKCEKIYAEQGYWEVSLYSAMDKQL